MRRRIDVDPDGAGLNEITTAVHLFDLIRCDGEGSATYPDGLVLRDEDLWTAYKQAEAMFKVATAAVIAASVVEPLDAVEQSISDRANALMKLEGEDEIDRQAEFDALVAEALAHAQEAP